MWLPTQAYERMPQFWLLVGLLFIADGLYLGLDISISFLYITMGLLSCAYGGAIAIVRTKHRDSPTVGDDSNTTPK